MKLELKHLAGYLPYGLKMSRNNFEGELIAIKNDKESIAETFEFQVSCSNWWENNIDENHYKPILRPLSDLTKEIEVNGEKFVPIEKVDYITTLIHVSNYPFDFLDLQHIPHHSFEQLQEWHFDIHGLITEGLAIDINTLYK